MDAPAASLRTLYTTGSLRNDKDRVVFTIRNRLIDTRITAVRAVKLDGQEVPPANIVIDFDDGSTRPATDVSRAEPIVFDLNKQLHFVLASAPLPDGPHEIAIAVEADQFGVVAFDVVDSLGGEEKDPSHIPRSDIDDYTDEIISARQDFAASYSGADLKHIRHFSIEPHRTAGNIENFTGVAQIPLGLAGPIRVNGESAQGEFLVPMATTEGTLVASYNRGIKLLNLCGGVTCTISDDAMQRAPVFIFKSARQARDFTAWVDDHFAEIARQAEQTSSVAKLLNVEKFLAGRYAFLRFNYATGDAAGQNMVGKATFAACNWILQQGLEIEQSILDSNFATDKKASQINMLRTRGKRVVAEAVIKRDLMLQHMRVSPEALHNLIRIGNFGAAMAGAVNNGFHIANAITAIFIATGQDVANVAESSAGITHSELTAEGDLYLSLTIPALIVATYGGGVGLATQRECLEIMGCFGEGKVRKFAEIVAGVALAGELSLASAIAALEWVDSHERLGRNR